MDDKLSNSTPATQPKLWLYCNVCRQRFPNVGELLEHWKRQYKEEFIEEEARGFWKKHHRC